MTVTDQTRLPTHRRVAKSQSRRKPAIDTDLFDLDGDERAELKESAIRDADKAFEQFVSELRRIPG